MGSVAEGVQTARRGADEELFERAYSGGRLGVNRAVLYKWQQEAEGRRKVTISAARVPAEPAEDPQQIRIRQFEKQVADLQGAVGEKTLELDFFAGALRRIEGSRQKKSITGEAASTPKSGSGCERKAD